MNPEVKLIFDPLAMRRARSDMQLTQMDLANLLRVSASTISRAENGKPIPSRFASGIAQALNIRLEELPDLEQPPSIDAIPRQITAATQFTLDAHGALDLVPDPPGHTPLTDAIQRLHYEETRHKALELASLGNNHLGDLSGPVERFLTAAPPRIEDVSIGCLWSRGNTLRRRVKAHQAAVSKTSSEPTDPARLPALVAEMLHDLVETYNVFIVGDPRGRELDQVRPGPQERIDATKIAEAAAPIVSALREMEGVATPKAVEALNEQVDSALGALADIDGDQASDQARKTTSNFVAEMLRVTYALVRTETSFGSKEIRAGIYRASGPAAIGAAYVYRAEILTFVIDNADRLKIFVEQAFHNPVLSRIIDVILQAGSAGVP
jgi:DNA-binding XRE family transcriptional regulator